MSRIRHRGTAPELAVRRVATTLGIRYIVRNADLPGSPDLANRTRKFAVFVHGCYWHRHLGCRRATTPKVNVPFWTAKFRRNVERDASAMRSLRHLGYTVVVVWECQTHDQRILQRALSRIATTEPDI